MIAFNDKMKIVALIVMALAVVGHALKIEPACILESENSADNEVLASLYREQCKACCTREGFAKSNFDGRCRCSGASEGRKRQEAALKAKTNKHICAHLSGETYEPVDGEPRSLACEFCCREHSFRTSTFKVEHNFVASVFGKDTAPERSRCVCKGLTLSYVPEESQQ